MVSPEQAKEPLSWSFLLHTPHASSGNSGERAGYTNNVDGIATANHRFCYFRVVNFIFANSIGMLGSTWNVPQ